MMFKKKNELSPREELTEMCREGNYRFIEKYELGHVKHVWVNTYEHGEFSAERRFIFDGYTSPHATVVHQIKKVLSRRTEVVHGGREA